MQYFESSNIFTFMIIKYHILCTCFVFNRQCWKILKQCLSDNQRAEITFSCSRLLTQKLFINYSYLLIISLQNIAFSFHLEFRKQPCLGWITTNKLLFLFYFITPKRLGICNKNHLQNKEFLNEFLLFVFVPQYSTR